MSPTLNKPKILRLGEKKVKEEMRSATYKPHHEPEKCKKKVSEMHVGIGADAHRLNFSLRRQIYLMKLCFGDSSRENVFHELLILSIS